MNAKPEWTTDPIALDPYAGSQAVVWCTDRRNVAARVAPHGVVVERELPCGVRVSLRVPAKCFEGVAARAYENEDGSCMVTLELLHADPQLSVPLLVCDDPEGAARDWRSWSRNLRLPMLIASAEGNVVVEDDAPVPFARRRRHTTAKHRPNFLRRRKAGRSHGLTKLDAREIIARN